MLLCYVDESFGDTFYSFAGLLVDGSAAVGLHARLDAAVRKASMKWGVPAAAEIHAYEVFHGKGQWSPMASAPRARVAVFHDVVDAFNAVECTVLFRAVHRARLRERQARRNYPETHPPEQVCFTHLLQRVQHVAERDQTHALVIVDQRDDMERHRELFGLYRAVGTPGWYKTTAVDRIVDTIHFAPSDRSRLLQAADVLAFLYHRTISVTERDPRSAAAMTHLWSKVRALDVLQMGSWPW